MLLETKWSNFNPLNTHFSWNFIIHKNINLLEFYKNEIINFINESQQDIINKTLLNQCNINATKIFIFLNIKKIGSIYQTNIQNKINVLTITQIKNLLPQCLQIEPGKDLAREKIHELDPTDIIENEEK